MEGKGTSTEPNHYSFIDELLHEGIYYYRLKQVDYDGSTNYSEEISIEYEYPGKFKVYPNYPNPFNPVTNLKVLLPNKSYLTIKLFNITGELVDIIFEGTTEGGIFNAQVSSKGLSSGVYFCKVTANELSGRKYNESIKILVLK